MNENDLNPYQAPSAPIPAEVNVDESTETSRQALKRWFRFCVYLIVGGVLLICATWFGAMFASRVGLEPETLSSWVAGFTFIGGGTSLLGLFFLVFGLFTIVLQTAFSIFD